MRKNKIVDKLHIYVKIQGDIPETITNLTGINNSILESSGLDSKEALNILRGFVGDDVLVNI